MWYTRGVMTRLLVLMLAGAMVALTPAALASPPDEPWLGGLYDNGDHDDVILAVMASIAFLQVPASHDFQFSESARRLLLPAAESLHATPRSSSSTRAPPTSARTSFRRI
jgi:hypothetical protein